jgi:hypothetical protein
VDNRISVACGKDLTDERKSCGAERWIIYGISGKFFKDIKNITCNDRISSILLPYL